MPRRTNTQTKEFLIKAPLPEHADTYTVIPHEFVINRTLEQLAANGFAVQRELYRCNLTAQVASGVYHLHYGDDPDIGMMFAWSNSYDKSMRFKCAIGGYVKISNSTIIDGDMGMWGRKHTGEADNEAHETIQQQIADAESRFNSLLRTKKVMKTITLTRQQCAEIAGRLYMEHNILTGEQLGIIKHQMKNPKYDYNAPADSMWTFYNHITYALQKAHPRNWMDHQRLVHWFLNMEFELDSRQVVYQHAAGINEAPATEGPSPQEDFLPENVAPEPAPPTTGPHQMTLEEMIDEVAKNNEVEMKPVEEQEETKKEVTSSEFGETGEEDFIFGGDDNGVPNPPPIDL